MCAEPSGLAMARKRTGEASGSPAPHRHSPLAQGSGIIDVGAARVPHMLNVGRKKRGVRLRGWVGFDASCLHCGGTLAPSLARCQQCQAVRAACASIEALLTPTGTCLISGDASDVEVNNEFCVGAEYVARMRDLGVLDEELHFVGLGTMVFRRLDTVASGGSPRDPVHLRQCRGWLAAFELALRTNLNLRDGSVCEALRLGWGWMLIDFVDVPADSFEIMNVLGQIALIFESQPRAPAPRGPAKQAALGVVR